MTKFLLRSTKLAFLMLTRSASSTSPRIGIIGCGKLGGAVSSNLLRHGFNLASVFDVDISRAAELPEHVTREKSARAVTESSDVVITGLPRPTDIAAAFQGPDGILSGLSEGKVWIDHSTTDFEQMQKFAKEVSEKGAAAVEAPITGGLMALRQGQMTVHIAGDKDVCERIRPILDASYSTVFYMGPLGSAQIVKVVSNMLCAVHLMAMGEALMIAKRANINLRTFWDAIRASTGNSFVWETGGPVVFNGKYDPGFPMSLFCKDLHLGYDIAKKFKVPLELHGLVQQTHNRVCSQYGEDCGCYSVPRALEESLGESLNVDKFEKWEYNVENVDGSLVVKHKNI